MHLVPLQSFCRFIVYIQSEEYPLKLWKMLLIATKMLFLSYRHSNFCNVPLSCPTFWDFWRKLKMEWLWNYEMAFIKSSTTISWKSQKPPWMIASNWWITKTTKLLNKISKLKKDWLLVQCLFCFSQFCLQKETGFENEAMLDFLRIFDNPLSK